MVSPPIQQPFKGVYFHPGLTLSKIQLLKFFTYQPQNRVTKTGRKLIKLAMATNAPCIPCQCIITHANVIRILMQLLVDRPRSPVFQTASSRNRVRFLYWKSKPPSWIVWSLQRFLKLVWWLCYASSRGLQLIQKRRFPVGFCRPTLPTTLCLAFEGSPWESLPWGYKRIAPRGICLKNLAAWSVSMGNMIQILVGGFNSDEQHRELIHDLMTINYNSGWCWEQLS